MKKLLVPLLLILGLLASSCAAPAKSDVSTTTSVSADTSEQTVVRTADDLRTLMEELKTSDDPAALYETAMMLLELEPENSDAYLVALNALVAMSDANIEEINRLLAKAAGNVDDPKVFSDWVSGNQPDYTLSVPFVSDVSSDQFNTLGITPGNMTNSAKYEEFGGWWIGGLMTFQGDYVYLTLPGENFAIYKMLANGEKYEQIGDVHGSNLNVIGEWIYFQNRDDSSRIYKMRTDGSMLTAISDEGAEFINVSGEQIFYHSWDNGCLYKMNTDGTGREKMVDSVVMFVSVYDGYVYYCEKSEYASLQRISVDGGKPEVIVESKDLPYLFRDKNGTESYVDMQAPFVQSYFFYDGWVYYFDINNPKGVLRASLNERKYELFFPFDMRITSINIAGDELVISYWNQRADEKDGFYISEEIVTIDINTLEEQNHIKADTEPILEGPDGWVYFYNAYDNYAWSAMSPEGEVVLIGK